MASLGHGVEVPNGHNDQSVISQSCYIFKYVPMTELNVELTGLRTIVIDPFVHSLSPQNRLSTRSLPRTG